MEAVMNYFAADIQQENKWHPFWVDPRPHRMRSVKIPEGIGDRIRAVAFAEVQAHQGFLWGYQRFTQADPLWRSTWLDLAKQEARHAQLLLDHAHKLEINLGERKVSDYLIRMFRSAGSPEFFQYLMVRAEARGMDMGLSMVKAIMEVDPQSGAIFKRIAQEEEEHIRVAESFLKNYDHEQLQQQAAALGKEMHG